MTFKAELPGEEAISSGSEEELLFGLRVTYQDGSWPWRFDARQSSREYLLASSDFTSCRIISKPIITGEMPDDPADEPRWRGLILGAMAAKGALSGMLLAHASAVEYEGEAVIFTAPSGSGKTTQKPLQRPFSLYCHPAQDPVDSLQDDVSLSPAPTALPSSHHSFP